MIIENKNLRYMELKELRAILKTQKYPKMVVEKALAIPQEQFKSEKLKKKKGDILPFISTYNPNNSNVFPKVRKIYGNLQTLKTLGKIFAKRKLIDCKRQPSNLKRLLCSRGGSRTAAISKVELFVIIVNGFSRIHIYNAEVDEKEYYSFRNLEFHAP